MITIDEDLFDSAIKDQKVLIERRRMSLKALAETIKKEEKELADEESYLAGMERIYVLGDLG